MFLNVCDFGMKMSTSQPIKVLFAREVELCWQTGEYFHDKIIHVQEL